ncbi:glycerate kinase [Limibacter armeniacum]|uniref:glycerate kinase n=1 Tax=Limibacter armeniacum TaxID=466084 RepID=UPI002FE6579C
MNILIAPNAFKGSLSAKQTADIMSAAVKDVAHDAVVTKIPIADGGDGFTEVMVETLGGELLECDTVDANNKAIKGKIGVVGQDLAIVDVATASGIARLDEGALQPMEASTFGTGLLIAKALDLGCEKVILGLGGSATTDAGTGILRALGAKFLDENGNEVTGGGGSLGSITTIDLSGLRRELQTVKIELACDVENPLFGKNGAAYVYAPQKGANNNQIIELDNNLKHFCGVLEKKTAKNISSLKGGGAAGGISTGLYALLGAELKRGAELVMDATGFDEAVRNADLVLTGEGSLDMQSASGKGTFAIAERCAKYRKPVLVFAGSIPVENNTSLDIFAGVYSILNEPMSLKKAVQHSEKLLFNAVREVIKVINIINNC